jgi:hypothetical protein
MAYDNSRWSSAREMIIQPECGLYRYNGVCYGTRKELLENLPPGDLGRVELFDYNDNIFSSINWKEEPDIPLSTLYTLKAKYLREKYDYLILSFSGGGDSNEILETFLRNNIFIDEIQTVNFNKMMNGIPKETVYNDNQLMSFLEYDLAVVPKLRRVSQLSPKTKITVMDASDFAFDQITNQKFEFMGLDDLSKTHSVKMMRSERIFYWYLHMINNENPIYRNKKVAFIRGYEKPSLVIKDNCLFSRFNDFAMFGVNMIRSNVMDNIYTFINFYWSSDVPFIPIKQGHVIKRYIEQNPDMYHAICNFNHEMKVQYSKNTQDHVKTRIERRYNKLLYQYHEEIPFVAPKPWKNPEVILINKIQANHYEDVIKEKIKLVGDTYQSVSNSVPLSRSIFTRHYNLGYINFKH